MGDPSIPAPPGQMGSRLIGGYELHELHGPFPLREAAETATCGGGERVVVEATDEEDIHQQLMQWALQRGDEPQFPP